ncbi:MAG: carboxypeptidase regulatory-like domain-containing protein [Thermoanaerobaculia bacterium]
MVTESNQGLLLSCPPSRQKSRRGSFRRPLLATALAGTFALLAGEAWSAVSGPVTSVAVRFAESVPARNLPARTVKSFEGKPAVELHKINEENERPLRTADPSARRDADAALSSNAARGPAPLVLPAVLQNFPGISLNDTVTIGQGFLPPDTNGEVGPNHFVQTVNSAFRVWDKSGNPLTATATLSSLFAPLGPPCGALDDGDPVVNYDQLADRWIISQFCIPSGNPDVGPFHQVFAVSKTGDPTGAYYLYDFVTQGTNLFPDYPHIGVWPDAYYMTVNQFSPADFEDSGMYAFNRAKMIAGDPTAGYVYFNAQGPPLGGNHTIGGMLPADLDGFTLPPAGSPCPFAYFTANEFGDPGDGIRLYDFHVDFAVPASSTFVERAGSPLAVAAFDPVTVPNTRNVVPQPGVGAGSFLDAINDRLMFRLAYRNFGTKETLVANHTVNAAVNPAYRAGVRVYQLSRPSVGANWVVAEQTTWAGLAGDTTHRWMGSAAQNRGGDLVVGFSASSATVSPSVRYAVRLSTDAPGTGFAQGEGILIAGTSSQTSTSGRWGDYSDLSVDPVDDCTFWYTQEFMNGGATWQTRIGSFQTGAPCAAAPPTGTLQGTITYCSSGLPISGALVQFSDGQSRATNAAGFYSIAMAPGTYSVTVGGLNYATSTTPGVVVTASATTTVNVCLVGTLKQPVADTTAVTAESCAPANSVLDPNETVTMNFGLKNTGTLDTANLVVTLQATGGVTAPSGPQNYGIVQASGSAVVRPFTFTVGSTVVCGTPVTVTLQLQDGATNLGTATFTLTAGVLSSTIASSGNVAAAIPDNNATGVDVPVTVPNVGPVTDVNVSVRLNHTFVGDLKIDLVHPDNTIVNLVNHRGGGASNFGTGANDCAGTPTKFDDQAATAITAGTPPWAGTFRSEALLAAMNGKPSAGIWKLRVVDNASADTGTVGCVTIEINKVFICCGIQVVAAPPASIATESFAPLNNAIDPNETVTVNLPLKNTGGTATTNLVATLQPTGGVNGPSAPQSYGVIPTSGTTSRPFSFQALGVCGGTLTATLALQDGITNAGTAAFLFQLGATTSVNALSQNFDSVVVPALPAGWTSTHTGGTADFVTSLTGADTAPNDAFAPDNIIATSIELVSPTLQPANQLTFRNLFNLEASVANPGNTFDGMVLDININGGGFVDIITAGGVFVAGGYTRTIAAATNPINGRQAWGGLSGGTTAAPTYITTTITLPPAANTQTFVLRWRVGTDSSVAAAGLSGVRIDTITTTANSVNCSTPVNLLNFSID